MKIKNLMQNKILLWLLWLLEGVVVGFGAILPGVSGGTLCVAFGMYRPLIGLLSSPKHGLKQYGLMLGIFLLGAAVGFVGLSGLAAVLVIESNLTLRKRRQAYEKLMHHILQYLCREREKINDRKGYL